MVAGSEKEDDLHSLRRDHAGSRVLVAEDDPVNLDVTASLLEVAGLHVVGVVNGRQAVEAAGAGQFDLFLLDIQMPVLDGLEAARQIRQLPQYLRTPIMALTARVFPDDRDRCLEAGMNIFLPKPIDVPEFFRAVLVSLETARLQRGGPGAQR